MRRVSSRRTALLLPALLAGLLALAPTAAAEQPAGKKPHSKTASPSAQTGGAAPAPTAASSQPTATKQKANDKPAAAGSQPTATKQKVSGQPAAAGSQPAAVVVSGPARIPAAPFIGPVASPTLLRASGTPAAPFIGPVAPRATARQAMARATAATPVRPAATTARRTAAAERHDVGLVAGADVLPTVATIVRSSVSRPEYPVALGLVVLLFLLVQHRIDRRDPKLARARCSEPDVLRFGPTIRYA